LVFADSCKLTADSPIPGRFFKRTLKTENFKKGEFPMSCTVCQHPRRQAIDQALMAKSDTLEALSQTYGLSTSALQRHKAHLHAKINRARDQVQDNLFHGCLFWLSQALEMSMQTAQAAHAEGNHKTVLQALAQGTRLIKIILKQDFHLDDRMVHQILTSPQWTVQTGFLPADPQILAAGRQSLSGSILAPCSENDDLPPSSESPDLDLDALQAMFSSLAQASDAQSKTDNRKLKTANRPFRHREKSGRLPGKSSRQGINCQLNQDNILNKKFSAKSALSGSGNWVDALDAGTLDINTLHAIGTGRNIFHDLDNV
jgi:hypothetical protein